MKACKACDLMDSDVVDMTQTAKSHNNGKANSSSSSSCTKVTRSATMCPHRTQPPLLLPDKETSALVGRSENATAAAAAAFVEARLERAHFDVASAAVAAAAATGDEKSMAAFGMLPTYLKDMVLAAHFLRGKIHCIHHYTTTSGSIENINIK